MKHFNQFSLVTIAILIIVATMSGCNATTTEWMTESETAIERVTDPATEIWVRSLCYVDHTPETLPEAEPNPESYFRFDPEPETELEPTTEPAIEAEGYFRFNKEVVPYPESDFNQDCECGNDEDYHYTSTEGILGLRFSLQEFVEFEVLRPATEYYFERADYAISFTADGEIFLHEKWSGCTWACGNIHLPWYLKEDDVICVWKSDSFIEILENDNKTLSVYSYGTLMKQIVFNEPVEIVAIAGK